jgi:hypothetical protein
MTRAIERRARKGRATWKIDSIPLEVPPEEAIERLRKKNPQFEFRFWQPKPVQRFGEEEQV